MISSLSVMIRPSKLCNLPSYDSVLVGELLFFSHCFILQESGIRIGKSARLPMPYPDLLAHANGVSPKPVETISPQDAVAPLFVEDNSKLLVQQIEEGEEIVAETQVVEAELDDDEVEEVEEEGKLRESDIQPSSAVKHEQNSDPDASRLSTLVIDTSLGKPAAGVPVCVSLSPILLLFDCDYFCFVG
jgi:hypothetical protein